MIEGVFEVRFSGLQAIVALQLDGYTKLRCLHDITDQSCHGSHI